MVGAESTDPLPPKRQTGNGKRIFAGIMLVIGAALFCLSGLCTTIYAGSFLYQGWIQPADPVNRDYVAGLLPLAFVIGGPFILTGAILWWAGRRMRRPPI